MKPEDLIDKILEEFYSQYNVTFQAHTNKSLLLARYFNFRLKLIPKKPRKIQISKESIANIYLTELKNDILKLFEKIEKGIDINPYQSKRSFNADYHDMLFNDWGIHHLHLSNEKKNINDYFHKRTGPLIFIKFQGNYAYIIDVKKHNDKNVWSNTELLRIIKNNWEFLIEPYKVGNHKWFPEMDDNEIGIMRNKGYTFPVNIDGNAYLLLGDGYSCSGDNMSANFLADEVYRWIGKNLDLFEENPKKFKRLLCQKMDWEII